MILSCLSPDEQDRTNIIPSKDYLYNDNLWLSTLQSSLGTVKVSGSEYDIDDCNVWLYGHEKDRSTYYLNLFPSWNFCETGELGDIDATRVRGHYFAGYPNPALVRENAEYLCSVLPRSVFLTLVKNVGTDDYMRVQAEHQYIIEYKKKWGEGIFLTVDAILIKSGHVLVVRRKGHPGRGLFAIPGGFLNRDERIFDGCLRELKEETKIGLPKDELRKRLVDQKIFDHPERSLRGRIITNAFCFDLGAGPLPKVKGDDDAEKAFWMPLRDVARREEEFFEDHHAIISYFTNRAFSV
jgi:bifunctional NMN adenylyltransferase/nudix hydrolase